MRPRTPDVVRRPSARLRRCPRLFRRSRLHRDPGMRRGANPFKLAPLRGPPGLVRTGLSLSVVGSYLGAPGVLGLTCSSLNDGPVQGLRGDGSCGMHGVFSTGGLGA